MQHLQRPCTGQTKLCSFTCSPWRCCSAVLRVNQGGLFQINNAAYRPTSVSLLSSDGLLNQKNDTQKRKEEFRFVSQSLMAKQCPPFHIGCLRLYLQRQLLSSRSQNNPKPEQSTSRCMLGALTLTALKAARMCSTAHESVIDEHIQFKERQNWNSSCTMHKRETKVALEGS